MAIERNGEHGALAQGSGDVRPCPVSPARAARRAPRAARVTAGVRAAGQLSVRECAVRNNRGAGVAASGAGSRALVDGGTLGGNRVSAVAADGAVLALAASVQVASPVHRVHRASRRVRARDAGAGRRGRAARAASRRSCAAAGCCGRCAPARRPPATRFASGAAGSAAPLPLSAGAAVLCWQSKPPASVLSRPEIKA